MKKFDNCLSYDLKGHRINLKFDLKFEWLKLRHSVVFTLGYCFSNFTNMVPEV